MIYTLLAAALALPSPAFEAWKREHHKTYPTAAAEAAALEAFTANDVIIAESNAKHLSYTLGHNEYSDMTWETFSQTVMSELFLNRAPKNMERVHLGAPY